LFFSVEIIQECFGEFDGAVKLINPTGTTAVDWVQINTYELHVDDNGEVCHGRFQCQIAEKDNHKENYPIITSLSQG
jgi:hypothetical protein